MSGATGDAPELRVDAVQVAGIYAPLQYMRPSDPTMGGYTWLDWTDGGQTRHPAVDLNSVGGGDADLGVGVYAAVDAVVAYVEHWDGWSTGYGSFVVLESRDARATPHVWLKHCHLDRIDVVEGQPLRAGQQCGTCGRSGNQPLAHLHWEVMVAPTPYWSTWPYQWSVEQIERYWMQPAAWWFATVASAVAQQGGGDVSILNGPQRAAVMTALWGAYPLNMDAAIPKSWADEWGAGRWKGRPVAAEQLVPEADENAAGAFQVFELGCGVWLPGKQVSWEG